MLSMATAPTNKPNEDATFAISLTRKTLIATGHAPSRVVLGFTTVHARENTM
jgi:hypothetical protein